MGHKTLGTVSNSCSTGSVTGNEYVGGLVGYLAGFDGLGTVSNSCSTGSVTGNEYVGGLVGWNHGTVSNSYSSSNVTGHRYVGGLAGKVGWSEHTWPGYVSDCYSVGEVDGDEDVGGLVGWLDRGKVSDSFWNIETSARDRSDGGTGKTTEEMQDIATFTDTATEGLDEAWDIVAVAPGETDPDYTWNVVDGRAYPFLTWHSVV